MRFAASAALVLLLAPSTAHAERRVASEWYGWQTLSFDAAAITSLGVAARVRTNDEVYGYLALFLYTFGGPTVHWGHGNVGRGFGSLGVRVGAPIVLGAAMCGAAGGDGWDCLGGWAFGAFLGVTAASAIDAGALAYDEVELPSHGSIRLRPVATITKQMSTFGVGATF